MEVRIDINRMDIWKFNRYHMIKRPPLRYILIVLILFIIFITVKAFIRDGSKAIILLALNIIMVILFYHILKWIIMRTPSSKAGVLGEHRIEINKNGLKESTKVNENFYRWAGIIKIVQNKEYIFIYTDNLSAHLIPKRSFADAVQAEHFYQYAFDLWNNNKANVL